MVEEPIRSDDIAGYKRLTKEMGSIRGGIESEQGLSRFAELIANRCYGCVQASLGWAGGFTGCRTSQHWPMLLINYIHRIHFFSAVMTAANIQLAASQVNIPFIEAEENENR